jgi:hypothetical protein
MTEILIRVICEKTQKVHCKFPLENMPKYIFLRISHLQLQKIKMKNSEIIVSNSISQ